MLKCPVCSRIYKDDKQVFCLNDGAALVRAENISTPTVQMDGSGNQYPRAVSAPQNIPVGQPPRKSKTSLWILGGVGFLMFTLFIGVLLVVGIIFSLKKDNKNTNTLGISASPTPVNVVSTNEKYEPQIKMAINSANNAQSMANSTLNASLLEDYYSGEALKTFRSEVEALKKSKAFQVAALQQQDYQYIKVNSTGTEAEVRVSETWETKVYHLSTKKCLLYYPKSVFPQTVYLKKNADGWMVDSVIQDTGVKRTPQACPKK